MIVNTLEIIECLESNYLNSAHESVLIFAKVFSSRVVDLEGSGQTFLDVDGPFSVRGIGSESRDLFHSIQLI